LDFSWTEIISTTFGGTVRGIVAIVKNKLAKKKLLGSPYRSGRSAHWVKVRNPKAPAVKREGRRGLGPLISDIQ
jgi:hypothetical protein